MIMKFNLSYILIDVKVMSNQILIMDQIIRETLKILFMMNQMS